MSDLVHPTIFEALLDRRLVAYAEGGVRPIDRYAVAQAAMAAGARRGWSTWPVFARPTWMTPVFLGLLLLVLMLAMGVAAVVGRAVLRTSLVAPAEGATVLDYWGAIHTGWVYVYADGRVLFQPEGIAEPLLRGAVPGTMNERRLTEVGIDLVRTGTVSARALLMGPDLPASAWADPGSKRYEPSMYALCFGAGPGPSPLPNADQIDVGDALPRLPADAQRLLRAKTRTYVFPLPPDSTRTTSVECSNLTPSETQKVFAILDGAGWNAAPSSMNELPYLPGYSMNDEFGWIGLGADPLLPDGTIKFWGG